VLLPHSQVFVQHGTKLERVLEGSEALSFRAHWSLSRVLKPGLTEGMQKCGFFRTEVFVQPWDSDCVYHSVYESSEVLTYGECGRQCRTLCFRPRSSQT